MGSLVRGWERVAPGVAAVRAVLLAIAGVPSYERYYAHACRAHPGAPPMGRDEFYRRQLERRYSRPGSRCC